MIIRKIKRGVLALSGLCLLCAGEASAQGSPEAAPSAAPSIEAATSSGERVPADEGTGQSAGVLPVTHSGFETGLRVGAGLPLGDVGEDALGQQRQLEDLTPWRAPFWVDFGYRLSDTTTLGAYFQVGIGADGDACAGACDWSDLRAGLHGQWRLATDASFIPWLGAGIGYESLEFRTLRIVQVPDEAGELRDVPVRVSETLGGPELLLQGGLDFQVESSLWVGPFVTATLGQYMTNDYECDPDGLDCPGRESFEGNGLHSWVTVGLRGSYLP